MGPEYITRDGQEQAEVMTWFSAEAASDLAEKVRMEEREACAKACEQFGATLKGMCDGLDAPIIVDVGPNFAEHVRAR